MAEEEKKELSLEDLLKKIREQAERLEKTEKLLGLRPEPLKPRKRH